MRNLPLFLLFFVLVLVACSPTSTDETSSIGQTVEVATETPQAAEAAETAEAAEATETPVVSDKPEPTPRSAPIYTSLEPIAGLTASPAFYPLGWSPKGVFAFLEIRESAGRGGYQVSIRIIDLIQDLVLFNATELDWDHPDLAERVFPDDNDLIASYFVDYWSEAISEANIARDELQGSPEFSAFPISYEGVNYFSSFDIIPRVEGDAIEGSIEAYDFWLRSDNNTSKLVYSAQPRAVSVSAAGYFLSPFEPRVAIVLVEERYVFEGNEPFPVITGSNMRVGFESGN